MGHVATSGRDFRKLVLTVPRSSRRAGARYSISDGVLPKMKEYSYAYHNNRLVYNNSKVDLQMEVTRIF
jgi:hypothetical protein